MGESRTLRGRAVLPLVLVALLIPRPVNSGAKLHALTRCVRHCACDADLWDTP
jgi:hypothetical protein